MELPQEMISYIHSLPPSSQNNARHIIRKDFERYRKLGKLGAKFAQDRYGFDFDLSDKDAGEPPKYNQE